MAYKYKTVRGLLADRKRWCQGQVVKLNKDGSFAFCMFGAARMVYGIETPECNKAIAKINAAIAKVLKHQSCGIIEFNDAHHRKHSDIVKVLKHAKV